MTDNSILNMVGGEKHINPHYDIKEESANKGFTGIEVNGVRFSNIQEMLVYMNKQRNEIILLEKENAELKEQIEKMKCWHKMDYNDKESCKKIPRGIQLLTEYDCGLFVAYCVNRWTGDHWEEHQYGITRWKEIKEN